MKFGTCQKRRHERWPSSSRCARRLAGSAGAGARQHGGRRSYEARRARGSSSRKHQRPHRRSCERQDGHALTVGTADGFALTAGPRGRSSNRIDHTDEADARGAPREAPSASRDDVPPAVTAHREPAAIVWRTCRRLTARRGAAQHRLRRVSTTFKLALDAPHWSPRTSMPKSDGACASLA